MRLDFVYNDNWADPEEYDIIPLSPELQTIKQQLLNKYITPHKTTRWGNFLPGYVLKRLMLADAATGTERIRLIKWAEEGAEINYLAARALGEIKVINPNTEPMPEKVKQHLKDLNERRREEKKISKVIKAANTQISKVKLPVFKDNKQQIVAQNKYPWIVPGTFTQDPGKPGGTIVQIKCQIQGPGCKKTRTIHLADAFQVKICTSCRNLNRA